MEAVTVSSPASGAQLGLCTTFSLHRSQVRNSQILAFRTNKTKKKVSVAPCELVSVPVDTSNYDLASFRSPEKTTPFTSDESSVCTLELDYNEAAAKLECLYNHDLATDPYDEKEIRRNIKSFEYKIMNKAINTPVRKRLKKPKRLTMDKRIALRKSREDDMVSMIYRRNKREGEAVKINNLLREYTGSTDFVSFDWKKMKMPAVLPASEQSWLFRILQPMKALLEVKEKLQQELGREPMDIDLAIATNSTPAQVRKDLEIGRAARKKLIKHNLRLVLFVTHKYFPEFASGPKFQDLCQAGVKGLITAIDRFEPKRKLQLSTIGFLWIRHAVRQYVTLTSFTRVSYGLESVRLDIQRVKLQLSFELQRLPEEEEILQKVGISARRYHEVLKVLKPVLSLQFRHPITQEESINGISDTDDVSRNKWQQPALIRLALTDVLESLTPKESLVIRQRYGLDGNGERTLAEIAKNLNISREMVRKHEVKGLKKLKQPSQADRLRTSIG